MYIRALYVTQFHDLEDLITDSVDMALGSQADAIIEELLDEMSAESDVASTADVHIAKIWYATGCVSTCVHHVR